MQEIERMEDELIITRDTFGKKIRMNFLRIGTEKTYWTAGSDLFGLGTLGTLDG